MPHNANRRTYLRPSGPRHNVIKNPANSTLTWKRIPSLPDPARVAQQKPPKPKEVRRMARTEKPLPPLTYNPFHVLKDWQ